MPKLKNKMYTVSDGQLGHKKYTRSYIGALKNNVLL